MAIIRHGRRITIFGESGDLGRWEAASTFFPEQPEAREAGEGRAWELAQSAIAQDGTDAVVQDEHGEQCNGEAGEQSHVVGMGLWIWVG